MNAYHVPVMLEETISGLVVDPDGTYVDVTFGGGGHSKEILKRLSSKGRLFAFDQDPDALSDTIEDERFTFIAANFRHLKRFLKLHRISAVSGILGDLGISSHQIDVPQRGFSYRFDGPLDMRMDQNQELGATQILNTYKAEELQQMFSKYGEVRNAKTLANVIVDARNAIPFKNTTALVQLVTPISKGNRNRYLAQVFQSLRIEVNDEMAALNDLLNQSLEVLGPGGRLVIIAYHSLEDRMTKNFLKSGNPDGTLIKDFYGNIYRPFKIITKKAVLPSDTEIQQNPRAKSAKLRIGEKINIA